MTTPPPLSPAAQAVFDASKNAYDGEYIDGVWVVNEHAMIAAAIRAVADQVAWPIPDDCSADVFNRQLRIRSELLAIAAELDGGNTTTETRNEPVTQPILWNGQTDHTGFPCIKVIEIPEILDGGNTTTETP